MQIPDQHRSGEVVGDPAQPQHSSEQEAGRDEQGEHRRELRRVVAACDREREHRRGDERRRRPLRADHQPAGRAEQHVRDRRQQEGVQAVDRREAGKLSVGHRRGQRERRDRQPGDEVSAGARPPVAWHVLEDGHRAHEQRILLRGPEGRGSPVRSLAVLRGGLSGSLVVFGHDAVRASRPRRVKPTLLIPRGRPRPVLEVPA